MLPTRRRVLTPVLMGGRDKPGTMTEIIVLID